MMRIAKIAEEDGGTDGGGADGGAGTSDGGALGSSLRGDRGSLEIGLAARISVESNAGAGDSSAAAAASSKLDHEGFERRRGMGGG